jgi:hypothetical protein
VLKNSLLPFWKQDLPHFAREKQLLRENLVEGLSCSERLVTAQVSVALSRVLREDWPGRWGDAFECIGGLLQRAFKRNDGSHRPPNAFQLTLVSSLSEILDEIAPSKHVSDEKGGITAFARLAAQDNGLTSLITPITHHHSKV